MPSSRRQSRWWCQAACRTPRSAPASWLTSWREAADSVGRRDGFRTVGPLAELARGSKAGGPASQSHQGTNPRRDGHPVQRALWGFEMLIQALTVVVQGLDHLDALVPTFANLGRRHAQYGAKDSQYGTVDAALLWTLEQGLGWRGPRRQKLPGHARM